MIKRYKFKPDDFFFPITPVKEIEVLHYSDGKGYTSIIVDFGDKHYQCPYGAGKIANRADAMEIANNYKNVILNAITDYEQHLQQRKSATNLAGICREYWNFGGTDRAKATSADNS